MIMSPAILAGLFYCRRSGRAFDRKYCWMRKSSTIPVLLALAVLPLPAHADEGAPALTGTCSGSYVCAQGLTGLTLTIERQSGQSFSGVFQFYPVKGNPAVPDGCFTVSGRVGEAGAVEILGSRWLKQPAGYITVDLHGRLARGGGALSGVVETPAYGKLCSTFELTKASTRPTIAASCRPEAPAISKLF